jgi:hypothetical protein
MSAVRNVTFGWIAACFALLGPAARGDENPSAEAPEIVVQLASGRQFRGVLDPSSTAQQLVLRADLGGITLRRPIQWERIVRLAVAGQPADVAALKKLAEQNRAQQSGVRGQGEAAKSLKRRIELRGSDVPQDETAKSQASQELPPQRVAMVTFDAAIANWDADVETDGLVVDVFPLDLNRYIVPSNGTLEVELFAPQRRKELDLAPRSGGDTFELVDRWTRAVTPEDFGTSGARLRLPFGAIHPELQPNWTASYYGLVHVRLAIPGQGVFEDSRDGVRIRPWAPNRDQLEMNTGQRFLSTENLGRRE